jgi:hypothetical protein
VKEIPKGNIYILYYHIMAIIIFQTLKRNFSKSMNKKQYYNYLNFEINGLYISKIEFNYVFYNSVVV